MRKRALIVGATGYDGLTDEYELQSVSWDRLDATVNLRDFDVVVFNLVALPPKLLGKLRTLLSDNISVKKMMDALWLRQSTLVVIGNPQVRSYRGKEPGARTTRKRETRQKARQE